MLPEATMRPQMEKHFENGKNATQAKIDITCRVCWVSGDLSGHGDSGPESGGTRLLWASGTWDPVDRWLGMKL